MTDGAAGSMGDVSARLSVTVTFVRFDGIMPQPSKGIRRLLGTRVPDELEQAAERRKTQMGFTTMNDYLQELIARDAGMPEYSPTATKLDRMELSIPAT